MTAVLSGEADIGFMGSETTIYTYNEGAEDYVVNFAQLTQRAGNFLVAREPMPEFSWSDLMGKNVLGGRKGGMPSHDGTREHIRGIYDWTSRKARARLARSNKKPPASASGSIVTIFCFILRCHSAADQETESEDNPVCRREHGQCTHPAHSHGRKPCNFHW